MIQEMLERSSFILAFISLCMIGCNNHHLLNESSVTDTLNIFVKARNEGEPITKFLLIKYDSIDTNITEISRMFIYDDINYNYGYAYLLVKKTDSLYVIRACSSNERLSDSIYMDLKKTHQTKVRYNFDIGASLQYVGKEQEVKNDSLMVFCGQDMGIEGEVDFLYYFDKDIHLHKVTTQNGLIMMIDKKYFKME